MLDPATLANEIMVTKLATLSPQMEVFDGISLLRKRSISGAPVVDGDRNFLGVFSEKCCVSVLTHTAPHESQSATRAKDCMVTRLITLRQDDDVFESIGKLLKHKISGAPVVDDAGKFLGVFSEKTCMNFVVKSAYDQLPTAVVGSFMNSDRGRTIDEDTSLRDIAELFLKTPYRRLAVLYEDRLIGQISRRDVIRAQTQLAAKVDDVTAKLLSSSGSIERSDHVEGPAPQENSTTRVAGFMDQNARTIDADTDLLSIAQIFLDTPYRRLPVVKEGKLVGQISRRDVLAATTKIMEIAPEREKALLYLSSIIPREEAPFN